MLIVEVIAVIVAKSTDFIKIIKYFALEGHLKFIYSIKALTINCFIIIITITIITMN